MEQRELENLGDKLQDMIEKAVHSKNYEKLNQSINQALNSAANFSWDVKGNPSRKEQPEEMHTGRTYKRGPEPFQVRTGYRESVHSREQKHVSALYARLTGEKVKNLFLSAAGGMLSGVTGIALLILIGVLCLTNVGSAATLAAPAAILGVAFLGGCVMLYSGSRGWARLSRFKKYTRALGERTYAEFEKLSKTTGRPVKQVKKDIQGMIRMGWFLEGHVDEQETCVITSNETYQQYRETQQHLKLRQKEEEERIREREGFSPEVQEVLDKGNEYLKKLKESNDAIPGEEISEKISRMEQIVRQIFKRAKEHPEIIPDLKKMMDYYLPMTVKLLDAYEEMDSQPIQGETIQGSKREIEDTLDTLNQAFERLLDSIFEDTAWDVSSDISVLHTMLAQEGLTGNDFQKESSK